MADIQTYLNLIKTAIYGKDVRQAIHDGIEECYKDGKAGAIDLVARQEIAELVAPSGEAPSAAEVTDARIGADGITYTSLGIANRTQFDNLKDDVASTGKDAQALTGDIVSSNAIYRKGEFIAKGVRATWRYSDLIDLGELSDDASSIYSSIGSVSPNGGVNPNYLAVFYFYDSENAQVGYYNQTVLNATFSIPAGAKKIKVKFGVNGTSASNTEVVYSGIIVSVNSAYKVSVNDSLYVGDRTVEQANDIVSDIEFIADNIQPSKNIFTSEFKRGSINSQGVYGSTPTGLHTTATEAYIPVESSMSYVLSWEWNRYYQSLYMHEYDENKTFIKYTTIDSWSRRINRRQLVTSATTKFVRFQFYSGDNTEYEQLIPEYVQLEQGVVSTPWMNVEDISQFVDYEKVRNHRLEVPEYYFANGYLTNKVAHIRQTMFDAHGNYDAFIFITDTHWEVNAQKSPALIHYLKKSLNINKVIHGGDVYDVWSQYYQDDMLDQLESAFGKRPHVVTGNHEYKNNYMDDPEIWYLINSIHEDIVIGDSSRNYYYFDSPAQKMRYVVLNIYGDAGTDAVTQFESAQQEWLQNVALDVEAGWGIIIIPHAMYNVSISSYALVSIPDVTDNLIQIVDNYSGNGEIICILQGHTHIDRVTATPAGIPIIITTCDKNGLWTDPDTGLADLRYVDRTTGTINEQAFDVVIVDKRNRKIVAERIGSQAFNGSGNNMGVQVEYREIPFRS